MASSSEMKNTLENFLIPLEEINSATNHFDKKNLIGDGGFGKVYKGKLSQRWGNRTAAIKRRDSHSYQGKHEFKTEVQMVSKFHHPNIISFIGYCDESEEMIIVYEYAINRSLDNHLGDDNRRGSLTWARRLIISLGAARGLEFLHSGLGDDHRVIHRDVKSSNILLDDNMEATICDFGLSRSSPRNQANTQVHTSVAGTPSYVDPLYLESDILRKESDVYSLGVVLFEMLSGMLVSNRSIEGDTLLNLVRRKEVDKIIDPHISGQFNSQSLETFQRVAYKCISLIWKERPTMSSIIKEIEKAMELQLEKYLIPLEEIKFGTNNFSEENYLGGGGFGKVYRGTLSESRPIRTAAIKRLNPRAGQGKHEFMNKVLLLSSCHHHQNIIAFIGYCDEGDEMIIAFEYANKSLDQYLRDSNKMRGITWLQRLKMCIGSARGLNQLHWGLCPNHRRIHGDANSANILLDDKGVAKISELRLSKFSPKNQLNTMAAGTDFYCDPNYYASNIPTKESDVFSFGVVLFEVLCGRLVFPKIFKEDDENDASRNLSELIRRHKDNLHMIIDPHISDDIGSKCLDLFTGIASKCLECDYKKRPTMSIILENLEEALSIEEKELPCNYKSIIRMSDQPMVYTNERQLYSLLAAGILIHGGKKWFSLCEMNNKNCLIISAIELFDVNDERIIGWESFPNSRFSHVPCFKNANYGHVHEKAMDVTATMLSLESTYAVFLICKYMNNGHKAHTKSSPPDIFFRLLYGDNIIHRLLYEDNIIHLFSAEWKDEEWMEVELFMFTNHMEGANFELHLEWIYEGDYGLYVEGIEFRPIEMATTENDGTEVEQLSELESDTDWERKLPSDYEEIISRATEDLEFSTKKELYSLLLKGILINENSMWFRLDASNGKKCVMLSAMCLTEHNNLYKSDLYEHDVWEIDYSILRCRFPTMMEVWNILKVEIGGKIKAHMLSPKTLYAAWLVYHGYYRDGLCIASLTLGNQEKKTRRVYLKDSSVTIRPMNDPKYQKGEDIGTGSVKLDRRRRKRDEDWYEVELFPFFNDMDAYDEVEVGVHINSTNTRNWFYLERNRFYLEGIEFRPQ